MAEPWLGPSGWRGCSGSREAAEPQQSAEPLWALAAGGVVVGGRAAASRPALQALPRLFN